MELSKIVIDNYKSIKTPATLTFQKDLPTVLIGKNGSGKTNVLEAVAAISLANTHPYGMGESAKHGFSAHIRLSEEDVAAMLPEVEYDPEKCELVAYSSEGNLKINRIRSEYLVSSIKEELADIRELAKQLGEAVDLYERQVSKISHDGYDELPIHGYSLMTDNGRLTNFNAIRYGADHFIKQIRQILDGMLKTFDDDEAALTFIAGSHLYFGWNERDTFKLKYVEPSLAKFEEKFVTINKTALKREITRINKATKDACDRITALIHEIEERTTRIREALDSERMYDMDRENRYFAFLHRVQQIMGRRCLFLKNESHDVIFKKEDRNLDFYYDYSGSILETYLRQVYSGGDRDKLLAASTREIKLSDRAAADFEAYLNQHIPSFDREMYDSISVQAGEEGRVSVFLNEKTGERISLNETSAGRRWYFTYYFMKSILCEGDTFVIDEPAAMLHPGAQKEVLAELMELVKRGIRVVYSTHSPYLIPREWQCVHFVTMTERGTEVRGVSTNRDLVMQMKELVGDDIFDVQTVFDLYTGGDPVTIGRKCYEAVRGQGKDLAEAAAALRVSEDTIKSWNRRGNHFRCPRLENVIAVCVYAKARITDLLR